MAVSSALVQNGARKKVWNVTATADADVAVTIAHGFGKAPQAVTVTPLLPNFYLNEPEVTTLSATNIGLTLQNAVGSGDADPQIRVIAELAPDETR